MYFIKIIIMYISSSQNKQENWKLTLCGRRVVPGEQVGRKLRWDHHPGKPTGLSESPGSECGQDLLDLVLRLHLVCPGQGTEVLVPGVGEGTEVHITLVVLYQGLCGMQEGSGIPNASGLAFPALLEFALVVALLQPPSVLGVEGLHGRGEVIIRSTTSTRTSRIFGNGLLSRLCLLWWLVRVNRALRRVGGCGLVLALALLLGVCHLLLNLKKTIKR